MKIKEKIKLPDKNKVFYWLKNIIFLAIPFIMMDIVLRVLGSNINYFQAKMVLPNILFNCIWILLIVLISLNLSRRAGRIFYGVLFAIFFIVFLTNCIYYSYTGFFFSFNLILMASEGSDYILDTILNTSPIIFIICAAILAVVVFIIIKFPKSEKSNFRFVLEVVVLFVILHICTPMLLGGANDYLAWDNWRNPRNVYENFNDSNKNMKICGLFEYTVRDFYMTFLKSDEKEDESELNFLENIYSDLTEHNVNDYTGIFKGKNVIMLQLEGIDDWLLNEEDMPNLYNLMNNSICFDSHYSYYNGGGSTFNSELAVNTGFITPVSYVRNAYSFNTNLFNHSLANLLKAEGYSVNAFHMNTGEYYSRRINYLNWGYDNYYGLLDENEYSDLSYELDRELILNKDFYDRMFNSDGPFMHYIITYTPHTPFNTTAGIGKFLAEKIYTDGNIPDLSEEESARLFAGETDYFVGLLMEALEDSGHMEDTIIVAYADHYLYTLNDKTILDKYKETNTNLINHTPFFIWSNDISDIKENGDTQRDGVAIHYTKTNSQIDILPTVLNMLGIKFYDEYYIGSDILDNGYTGFAFFSDYSWYDGNVYVENGEAIKGSIQRDILDSKNTHINELIQKNDLTLKYDYFRKLDN
ncbi:MAG: sulfatase-like hydrolase/transferase [Lachnospiraceae bacterium]|nr:sulfatase-like hydrolase/transferase [Lachnospiraceae bacterium]